MIRQISSVDDPAIDEIFKRMTSIESVMDSVRKVADDVKENGDSAVRKYTKQFDGVELNDFEVSEDELSSAVELIDYETIGHLEAAMDNIEAFHSLQLPQGDMWLTEISPGIRLGQKYTPLSRIGAYVPGGQGSYPSSALMLVVPAKVAGDRKSVV